MKARIIIYFLAFFLADCRNAHLLSPENYVKWVENEGNGLHRHRSVGNISYDLQYKPLDYICLQEKNNLMDTTSLAKRKKELEGLQYYQLRISADKKEADVMKAISSDDKDMYSRISYLQFAFAKQISLTTNGQTLPCVLYHFQQYQGLTPYVDLVFAFKADSSASHSKRTLFIDDNIFGAGPLYFEFPADVFDQTPQINL